VSLDNAIQRRNAIYGEEDESLAIDGKVMRNAIDKGGRQTHMLSGVGHHSKNYRTQKSRFDTCQQNFRAGETN
jgi:hypothetical protein